MPSRSGDRDDPHGRAYVLAIHERSQRARVGAAARGRRRTAAPDRPRGLAFPSRDLDRATSPSMRTGLRSSSGRPRRQAVHRHRRPRVAGRTPEDAPRANHRCRPGARHHRRRRRVLAWNSGQARAKFHAWVAERRPGQSTFDPPRALGTHVGTAVVLADRAGGVTVVWNNLGDLQGDVAARGGSFSAPVGSAAPGADGRPRRSGATAAWSSCGTGRTRRVGRTAPGRQAGVRKARDVVRRPWRLEWPKVAIDDRRGARHRLGTAGDGHDRRRRRVRGAASSAGPPAASRRRRDG